MLLEKNHDKRLVVEVSDDNRQFNYLIEFRQWAFSAMAANGVSASELLRRVVFGSKAFEEIVGKRSYRFIFYCGKEVQIIHEHSEILQMNTYSPDKDEIGAAKQKFDTLTAKEILVLRFILQSQNPEKLGNELKIKNGTYKVHKKHVFEKLQIHST